MFNLALATLMLADSPIYFNNNSWTVFENEDNCSAIAIYKSDTTLSIAHVLGTNRTTFVIIDPALKSVTSDKKYELNLYFSKINGLDDGWGKIDVDGIVLNDGSKGLRFVLRGSEALDDVAISNNVALVRDKIVVESLSLSGSRLMVDKLRACSRKVHERNPSDPLAGAEVVE